MKIYGQIEGASLENLTSDPAAAVAGRIYLNTTTGKAMLDDGTSKRALFRNDGKFIYGTDTTAANNIKFHHAGAGILQILPGNDTTAENVMATSLAQVGLRVTNLAAAPAVGNAGRLYFNTTTNSVAFDTGAAFLQFATLTGTETLTNKTLTTPVVDVLNVTDQTNTPATPASGTLLYTKAGSLYKIAPDGLEVQVGSGASGGVGYNYLTNGDFESGIGTVQYASTSLSGGLPSGTGPTLSNTANSITLSLETASPLRRTRSLRATAASAWTAGQGFSVGPQITVQPGDLGRILTVNLVYQVVTGANTLGYTGVPGTQGLAIAVYDVTAGAWVPAPIGSLSFNSGTGPQTVAASFQSSTVSGQKYQVFVFNLVTSTAAVTVLFDDVSVGPNVQATNDSKNISATLQTATATAQSANTPIKFTTVLQDTANLANAANGTLTANGSGTYQVSAAGLAAGSGSSDLSIFVNGVSRIPRAGSLIVNAPRSAFSFPVVLNANDVVTLVPLTAVTLTDTVASFSMVKISGSVAGAGDPKIVIAKAVSSASQNVSAGTKISFGTPLYDNTGSFSAANSNFTCGFTGFLDVYIQGSISSGGTTPFVYKNGTQDGNSGMASLTTAGASAGLATIPVVFGDVIDIRADATATIAAIRVTFKRATGPVANQQVESVNATYNISSAQAVAAGAVVKYDARQKDTHNAYSPATGLFTCPLSGQMSVSVVLTPSAANTAYLVKNGAAVKYIVNAPANTVLNGSVSVSVQAGDTLGVYFDVASNANAPSTRGFTNEVTFERTGN